ncbi:MAG: DUF1501 domain-containing protein [Dehalococcoidia bacterium]
MTTNGNGKAPVLVVLQMTGGNDFMNTLVPFTEGIYYDSRRTVRIEEDQVIPINDKLGFHPAAAPLKEMYDKGDVAIIQGIGYENAIRSHFRAMDIMHTAEPNTIATEGWLAKAIRQIDPDGKNVLTGVSFGRGLPRAMAAPGVRVTSVGDLDGYGLMTSVEIKEDRAEAMDIFKRFYTPGIGNGPTMAYLKQTGEDVLTGIDRLQDVPGQYDSTVEYEDNGIAKALRDVARTHIAGLGTRIFYVQHPGYDHHAIEMPAHEKLLGELSGALRDFMDDLREHDAAEEVVIYAFTEFGRRVQDNGSGTDHGSGGGAFIIGERVEGGLYAEYPSMDPKTFANGEDLAHTFDFRGVYATLLEQWLSVDSVDIVNGKYEQLQPFKTA